MAYENEFFEWEEGDRRLRAREGESETHRALLDVQGAVRDELRRRLGSSFRLAELVDVYRAGTDWCLEIAMTMAPERTEVWDTHVVAGSAFFAYAREASDYRFA